jgi:NADH dehydrogenase (ubiquinone) Fe-S protein 1
MPGQKVFTNTPRVHKAREGVMEFLLSNHPLDCPICDQGGECDLQDQSMRYGSDRSRFHEIAGKRAVENKEFGPIVKTSMNRCIQCTRCVRFANDVAGVEDLGTSGRGNDLQIGTYIEKTLNSEISGNIIDLCPVGALTSKPYQFQARPWELKKTESIDVLDAVGSNIRVDSRGVQVMRIQPKLNDDVNEEWITDKTRYAYDGLRYQRLTTPLIREGDRFVPATWEDALEAIRVGLAKSGAKGDEIKAVAGALADTESIVALKDLVNRLGSENTTVDTAGQAAGGVDLRASYLFNTGIANTGDADAVLFIGTNPRHEAAIINTRFRKSYLYNGTNFAVVGEDFDSTFEYESVGKSAADAVKFLAGETSGEFAKLWKEAKKPLVVIGSAAVEGKDGAAILKAAAQHALANKDRFLAPEWTGFSVLQRAASRAAAYDVGFTPSASSSKTAPKFVYLLNADDIDPSTIPENAFVVYQGHHGDVGAQYADVCLPGAAYTEKSTTWINTEGRAQLGRTAVPPPGAAREDWQIVRALSEVVGEPLPYDDVVALRDRLWDVSPTLVRYDELESPSSEALRAGLESLASASAAAPSADLLKKPLADFYRTDPISRASVTMAQCSKAFTAGAPLDAADVDAKQASYA